MRAEGAGGFGVILASERVMSGISSGIGLISGIDTATLIDQLMEIEAQPVVNLQGRVRNIDLRRTALLEISAKILALKSAAGQFDDLSFFKRFNASSTNDSVLTASAGKGAIPSSHTFRVRALAANHSLVSRGFNDADTSPIGVGTMTIEVGHGRVNSGTELSTLNGGQGIRRGTLTITDRSGATADIDLSGAVTVEDVLTAINSSTAIKVRARVTAVPFNGVSGDRIVIEDLTPEETIVSNLVIADSLNGSTATDLGIVANVAGSRVDGHDLVRLSNSTALSMLNDGNGVDAGGVLDNDLVFIKSGDNPESFTVSLSDNLKLETDLRALNSGGGVRLGVIRITDRSGESVEVDLSDLAGESVATVGAIRDRITEAVNAAGVAVSITPVNSRLQITDTSGAEGETAGNLVVEDVTGFAAADLGIAADVADSSIQGRNIYRVATIGDVINAINYAPGNNGRLVEAGISADGNSITLVAREFNTTVTVAAAGNSTAARDLGLLDATFGYADGPFKSRHLIAGLNTVLLQSLGGGNGVSPGEVRFTDRLGRTTSIDFGDPLLQPHTLQDVIDLINSDTNTGLAASVNTAGNGIEIRDESGGSGPIIISDLGDGTMAADLGIAGTFDLDGSNAVAGANLQLQYVSRQTRLADLNAGRGITPGDFLITDSTGAAHAVNLANNLVKVGQVIDAINRVAPEAIEARINDTGDGIVVIDKTNGPSPLTIEDVDGGQTAANLRLAGSAEDGESIIDGSYEIRIEVGPADTLNEIARKLNNAGADVSASVLNSGAGTNPYSLTITSTESGRRGALVIDARGFDLGLTTMSRAQDALLSIGDESSGNQLLITSSSNTVNDVIDGVTLNLLAAADEDVTVTVSQDVDGIVEQVNRFVEKYNEVQDAIDDATSFNSDTLERGPLFGDSTVDLIRTRLYRTMSRAFDGVDPSVSRLFRVGLRLGTNNRLEFDEQKFRDAYEQSPELVEQLFTTEETGFGARVDEVLDELSRDFDGVIARKDDLLSTQQDLLNDRIDQLNVLLDAKRARLEAQFIGLESALAMLQGQQNALTTLAQLASGMSV